MMRFPIVMTFGLIVATFFNGCRFSCRTNEADIIYGPAMNLPFSIDYSSNYYQSSLMAIRIDSIEVDGEKLKWEASGLKFSEINSRHSRLNVGDTIIYTLYISYGSELNFLYSISPDGVPDFRLYRLPDGWGKSKLSVIGAVRATDALEIPFSYKFSPTQESLGEMYRIKRVVGQRMEKIKP